MNYAADVKKFQAVVRLNMRAQGILMKKLPVQLLKRYEGQNVAPNLDEEANTPKNRAIKLALRQLLQSSAGSLPQAVRGWARGGIELDYIEDILQGLPFVRYPNVFLALKTVYIDGQYRTRPVGFLCYGTFKARRIAAGVDYTIRFKGPGSAQLNQAAEDGRIGDIEAVVTSNENGGMGVGKAMVEFALADIMSRKKAGAPRFSHVVLNTTERAMKNIAQAYQFRRREWGHENVLPATANRQQNTAAQLRASLDRPSITHYFSLDLPAKVQAVLQLAERRVANTNLCPVRARQGTASTYWPLCR